MRNSFPILPDRSKRLALVIGNSRLHWAVLSRDEVFEWWDTAHLDGDAIASLFPLAENRRVSPTTIVENLLPLTGNCSRSPDYLASPLLLASVVPAQTRLWQQYVPTFSVTLDHAPLQGIYSTLGIDRALAVVGAGNRYGFPVLVIDGGTALTFTGADSDRTLIGGAILPGLRLQGRSLNQQTAALPDINFYARAPVPRWATSTSDAIRSGILHTTLAGIADFVSHWRQHYPDSVVVFTGGDGELLLAQIHRYYPHLTVEYCFDPILVFRGIQVVMNTQQGIESETGDLT